jgi:transcriptional regulator GlxA family with amidase domain
VLFLLYDDLQSLDVTGPLEVFSVANRLPGLVDEHAAHADRTEYRLRTASIGGRPVRTSSGLRLTPDVDLAEVGAPHTLLVPGGAGAQRSNPLIIDWLRHNASAASRIVSVCTGAFLLAEAGLLNGRQATTHWRRTELLAKQYPLVSVQPEPIFVRDGTVYTSAGVTAGMDLALALVEDDLGRTVALDIARQLVMFLRRPGNQTQFSAQLSAQAAHRQPLREVQSWVAEHPEADLSVETLAQRAGLSPRQFARAFTEETGVSPGRYVDQVRLESARRHLEDTDSNISRVARFCGYGTTESMRRAFLRTLGISPAEYRRRFTASL